MSADNGFIIRRNDAGKFALQMYFDSDEGYPAIRQGANGPGIFNTLQEAKMVHDSDTSYGGNYWSEYGLTVDVPQAVYEKQQRVVKAEHDIWVARQRSVDSWISNPVIREEFFVTEEVATREASRWSGYGIGEDIKIEKITVKA